MAFGEPIHSDAEPISEINVTPFIDVMLVLFVILLLSVPALVQTMAAKSVEPAKQTEKTVKTVFIGSDGVSVDGVRVTREELEGVFRKNKSANVSYVITGKRDAAYETAVSVLAAAKAAGISDVSFETRAVP